MSTESGEPEKKKLLGESVEASRAKRLEKQQARYRDRGGIFVPSESNPLLDVLLARGVNGESPKKHQGSRKRSRSASPVKSKASRRPSELREKSKPVKSKAIAKPQTGAATSKKPLPKQRTTNVAKTKRNNVAEAHGIVEGPSTQDGQMKKSTSSARKTKDKHATVTGLDDDVDDDDKPLRRTVARAKKKQDGELKEDKPSRGKSVKARGKQSATRVDDEPSRPEASRTKPKKSVISKPALEVASQPQLPEGSDAPVATYNNQKRKGRIKPVELDQESSERPGRASSKAKERSSSAKQAAGANVTAAIAKKMKNLKRPLPITDSDNDRDNVKVCFPPARKKPRLPTPSDSEDDLPLASRKTPVILEGARRSVVNDRNPVNVAITKDPRCTSTQPQSPSGIIGEAASSAAAHIEDSCAVAGADTKNDMKSDRGKHPAQVLLDRRGKSSGVELEAAEQGQEVKARARPRKKGSRKRTVDEHACVEEQTKKLTDQGSRAPKRRKCTPNEAEVNRDDADDEAIVGPSKLVSQPKRLISFSRHQKENKADPKKASSRKPKPRLSMFPTPGMAVDSDDELDLLR